MGAGLYVTLPSCLSIYHDYHVQVQYHTEVFGPNKKSGGQLEALYPRERCDRGKMRSLDDNAISTLLKLIRVIFALIRDKRMFTEELPRCEQAA